jgi:small-conductance mechanosensitive channel
VADTVCPSDGGNLCRYVEDLTHSEWLAHASNWLIAKPFSILMLIVIAIVIRWVIHRTIDRLTRRAAEGAVPGVIGTRVPQFFLEHSPALIERRKQRAETMGGLLKSITTGVIAVIVLFMIISQLGYDIAPLIAGAGIIGVALGFGSQTLVKDFLSGIFMILEDQYGVGDTANLGVATGTIEAVGLRVTRLRDVDGTVWYVRNGEVLAVGNMSQQWARTVLDIPVAFSEDLARVRAILLEVAESVWNDADYRGKILEEPEVWGVERWDPDGVVVRVVLKTAPLEQWNVARETRERIKDAFDAHHIEIPLPQRVTWTRPWPPPGLAESDAGQPAPDDAADA